MALKPQDLREPTEAHKAKAAELERQVDALLDAQKGNQRMWPGDVVLRARMGRPAQAVKELLQAAYVKADWSVDWEPFKNQRDEETDEVSFVLSIPKPNYYDPRD